VKRGWVTKPLGEVCTLQRGFDLPTPQRIAGPFPLVSSSGIIDTHAEGPVKGPGIVTGRSGSIGKIFFITDDFWPLNTTLYVRNFHGNDPQFIFYLLNKFDLKRFVGGAGVPTLNRNDVHSESVFIPEAIPEQQRIVAILDESFDNIAKARANAEKKLRNTRELFESHVHSAFAKRVANWRVKTLNQIATNLDNKRIPITKRDRKPGNYPYYGASGIVDYVAEYIFDGDTLLISEDGANLIARSTPIAFPASGKYWVNNHAHILKFEDMATQRFVEFYLESIKLDKYITGAAQPKLNQKALNSIPIPIPDSVADQMLVVTALEQVAAETQRLESIYQQKIAALDELKQSLLHQAFSGQL